MILWFPWTPKSLIYSESGSPLSTPLTFKKCIPNSVCQTLPTSASTEWRNLSLENAEVFLFSWQGNSSAPQLLTGEPRQVCRKDCGPSFFSKSNNVRAELLLIVTKNSETSEQGLDHVKSPKWSFVAVSRCCCIRYILLPDKRAGRKKT